MHVRKIVTFLNLLFNVGIIFETYETSLFQCEKKRTMLLKHASSIREGQSLWVCLLESHNLKKGKKVLKHDQLKLAT